MNNLPNKWFIEVTEDNFSIIDKWVCTRNGYHPTPPRWVCNDGGWSDKGNNFIIHNYTEITTEQFKKYVLKQDMKTELLGLPIIKGEKHHLKAFVKDVEQFGYRNPQDEKDFTQTLKLNGNQQQDILNKESAFKSLFSFGSYYSGDDITIPIKEFQLPFDWSIALDFMKENMDRWNKIQEENKEPEFKIGDIVIASINKVQYIGQISEINPNMIFMINWEGFNYSGGSRHKYDDGFHKIERKATPEEIEEYNNPFKVGVYVSFTSKQGEIITSKIKEWGSASYCILENGLEPFKHIIRVATKEEIENSKIKIFKMTSSSGDFELEVSKKGIYYRPEDKWFDASEIQRLLSQRESTICTSRFRMAYSFDTVTIGCRKGMSIDQIKEVYDYYKSLQ